MPIRFPREARDYSQALRFSRFRRSRGIGPDARKHKRLFLPVIIDIQFETAKRPLLFSGCGL